MVTLIILIIKTTLAITIRVTSKIIRTCKIIIEMNMLQ